MFLKLTSLFFIFALLPASHAHAGVAPQLGVNGTPKRSDVKRPSNNQPCGNGVNIASALDTSTAVPASANGDVKVTVLNFNAGADGSREVTSKVDPSGTGKNFVKMTVTVNGDPAPKNTGSQEVIAKLPAGTKCTGGSKKNKCLVQFVTSSGFGNCVVVSQGPTGNTSSSKVATAKRPADNGVKEESKGKNKDGKKKNKDGKKKKNKDKKKVAAKKSETGKGKGGKKNAGKKNNKKGYKKEAGTRAPRALLADLS